MYAKTMEGRRMTTSSYHIYINDKVLFKNLTIEEFELIWKKLYTSYWKEELTYSVCFDQKLSPHEEASF